MINTKVLEKYFLKLHISIREYKREYKRILKFV
nr:MAG TPA: protein of unknown function DUF4756 [Caudoviricetes sp.]